MDVETHWLDHPAVSIFAIAIFLAPLLLGFSTYFFVQARKGNRELKASRDWLTTTGRILFASVQTRSKAKPGGGRSYSHYPVVVYQYMVQGQIFTGQRFHLGRVLGYGSKRRIEKMIANYPVGSETPIYYNPDNPTESVLQRAAPSSRIFIIVAILLAVMYVFAVIVLSFETLGRETVIEYFTSLF